MQKVLQNQTHPAAKHLTHFVDLALKDKYQPGQIKAQTVDTS